MTPRGYTRTQIILHWLIAVMVIPQYLFKDRIGEAYYAVHEGRVPELGIKAQAHIWFGVALLVLVIWRIALKVRRGAPAQPENEPAILKLAAQLTHLGLYLVLLLMPISGALAWFAGFGFAAEAHEILKTLLLALIAVHVLGALYQKFVLKSDVMERMVRPEA